ncbi:MAG: ATP-binding cassette domain-containing protein [Acidimicrobiia bacterium]
MSVEVAGVSHHFGTHTVLTNINASFHPGTITALLGPSGSGKTTLLAIIGGLIKPSVGQVTRPNISPGKLQWIHQSVNVLGRRSAIDNVAVSLYAQGSTRAEALVVAEAALERVGLAGFATRRVTTLSGGEMQRVSIARALACRPTLVLADEPTGQLDRSTTQTVADALVALRESGAVVIIATHDPIVAAICDRRIEIVDGQINEAA